MIPRSTKGERTNGEGVSLAAGEFRILRQVDLQPYRSFMVELARRSGELILPYFLDGGLKVELKDDASEVTEADRGAERLLREMITDSFPGHGIVGEEYGADNPDAEFVWVLDPIDGTSAFVTGVPLWGTLIALTHEGQPLLGCIHQPVLGQLLIGDGVTTTLNEQPVQVRHTSELGEAVLLHSDQLTPAQYQDGEAFDELASRCRLVRTWGDCYGYVLLATGRADIMCDPIMNRWDIDALVPVVQGAGGVISDWQGKDPIGADSIVAATPGLHRQVMEILNG